MHLHLLTTLFMLLFSTLTLSAPASSKAQNFSIDLPWKLANIIVFEAAKNSTLNSSLTFTFDDPNKGMQLKTNCIKTVKAGQDLNSNFYEHCSGTGFTYQYNQGQIAIHRTIKDPRCVEVDVFMFMGEKVKLIIQEIVLGHHRTIALDVKAGEHFNYMMIFQQEMASSGPKGVWRSTVPKWLVRSHASPMVSFFSSIPVE